MKQATFNEGIGIALIGSITAAAVFMTMTSFFLGGDVFRLLVAGLSFAYILYLFARSQERTGRVTVIFIWCIVTVSSIVFLPSLLLYLAVQLAMIWLIRSLYFYSSILASLTDLTLTGVSLMVAIWAWTNTQSLFLGFWCFFLVQALFVFIPKSFKKKKETIADITAADDQFERAYHVAEVAVSRLVKTH